MIELPSTIYGKRVLKVEPFSVERVPELERHGSTLGQFTLWLGSNITIADFALGFLPVSLGMSWTWALLSIFVGNVLGALALALCSAMGPSYGLPQLIITRDTFGRVGSYLPAVLNFVSTIGWFTVNNILGSFGLHALFPSVPFWLAAILLVCVQGCVATLGYNFIHRYEQVMSVALGIVFLIVTILCLHHQVLLQAYHPAQHHVGLAFVVMIGATFSYLGSWGPYASDYSRYLQGTVSKRRVGFMAGIGSFIASAWLEMVGMLVAVLAAGHSSNAIQALHDTMGRFGAIATVAIILGGTAADAINLYSNSLAARAMDIKIPRWSLVVVASLVGLGLSLLGKGEFESNFENFLLLIGYWITPWMGVLFADFYLCRRHRERIVDNQRVRWKGLVSFLIGLAVSLPFMDNSLYKGALATAWGGVDIAFYVGFAVTFGLYIVVSGGSSRERTTL